MIDPGALIVFTGPTLSAAAAHDAIADANRIDFRPPVAQGDLYLAARERPWGIGIVDGYFDRVAAVWHKEILWALEQGVHVFGAASLGALRAVECAPFGMEGVGEIYGAFARGELTDDDEVTVAHGPASSGYAAGSEAMVNVRATLARATAEAIIERATGAALLALAKGAPYPERGWPSLLARARTRGLAPDELATLEAWLPAGRVDQKRLDAIALVERMLARRSEHPEPFRARFHLQRTDAWEAARREADGRSAAAPSAQAETEVEPLEAALDEVRLAGGPAFRELHLRALVRALALEVADLRRLRLDAAEETVALARYRHRRGIDTDEGLAATLDEQRLAAVDLARLACEEALLERVLPTFEPGLAAAARDVLRVDGRFGPVADRADAKGRALGRAGLSRPGLADAGLTEETLWRFLFVELMGSVVPDDLGQAARDLGFTNEGALRRAALREFLFRRGGETE